MSVIVRTTRGKTLLRLGPIRSVRFRRDVVSKFETTRLSNPFRRLPLLFFSFLNCLQAAGTHEFRLEPVFAAKTGLRWSRPCSRTTYLRLLHVEKVRANVESDALRAENVPERHDNVQEERRALPQPNHPVRYAHEQKWIAENEWEVRHYFSTVVARQPAKVAHKRYKKNAKAPYETSEAVNKLRFAVDRHKRESAA